MDIKKYVEKVLEISSKTIKIKKNTWFKDLSNEKIIVNNSIVDMTKEMGLMLKLIFYFDYISDINLRTITLPILPDNRYKNYIKIMKSMKLIKEYKRGLGKIFYQLGTNGFDILSDKEFYQRNVSSKKNSLSGRANATIEDNDLRAAYLGEKVLAACNNRFIEILDEYSEEEKNGYILNLFIQNISFDLMLKEITSNPDMQNHLSNLGFTEKEEIQFFSVRGYNQTIRRKYCNKVQIKMLGEDYVPLGYEQYFQSYKEYITKTENVFERFYFLCQLQELDSFDYFSLVTDTIKSCINGNEDSGNSSNLIKFQTEEVRNRLLFLLEEMAKRNGDNVKESNKLKLDAKIYKLNNDISIYNAIISNLKRMEKALRSNKESSPEEYTTIVSFIEAYSNLREKIQELSKEEKTNINDMMNLLDKLPSQASKKKTEETEAILNESSYNIEDDTIEEAPEDVSPELSGMPAFFNTEDTPDDIDFDDLMDLPDIGDIGEDEEIDDF